MTWVLLGVISSFFLGIYDIFKKLALRDNAVLPVLFFSMAGGASIFVLPVLGSQFFPEYASQQFWFIESVSWTAHLHFFLKAVIVVISWMFTFFAIKHLPITIVGPIRATGPMWVLIGAILIFQEQLSGIQWIGISVTLVFFYLFSFAGNKEGINFKKDIWVLFVVLGTLVGSMSSLYDKYLLQYYDRIPLQAYFSFYQIVVMLPIIMLLWWPKRKKTTPFEWRWMILPIGVLLVLADFAYFYGMSMEGAMVSIFSALRRTNVIYSFIIGAFLFKERNKRIKGLILIGIMIGVGIIIYGSR